MVKTKKILSPKISSGTERVSGDKMMSYLEEGEFYQVELKDEKLVINQRQIFMGSLLNNVSFDLEHDSEFEFMDCIFEKCDWSNQKFSGTGFYRCIFKDCKFLGTDFTNCYFQDVQFSGSLMRYANFSSSVLKSVQFLKDELIESTFIACEFTNYQLLECQIDKSNFWETNLSGVDFSSNTFDKIDATPQLLKGVKISLDQAPFFTQLLGIEII